jgi:hypothetical protein
MNVGQNMFAEELLEIGAKANEKYVIVHDNEWEKCPMRQRKEFEVLHIPHNKNNTVYVFVDVEINYDLTSEEEINFDGFKEMKYSCLEVSRDLHSVTALVCGDQEGADDKKPYVKKCCPKGQGLSRNISSCSDIADPWIPPRSVLHHITEKMTVAYKLIDGQELYTNEEIHVVETAQAVTTKELFKAMSEVRGPQSYHCVDVEMHRSVPKLVHDQNLIFKPFNIKLPSDHGIMKSLIIILKN